MPPTPRAVQATRPPLTRPRDFFPFWSDTLEVLARTPPDPRLGVAVTSPEGARITPVRFRSLHGRSIQGFLITPAENRPGAVPAARRPLVVSTHGYNSQSNPVLDARHTAASGADLFCFDVRGFGLSRPGCPTHPGGWVLTGLADPETSILRGAVCDFVRAAEVAVELEAGRGGIAFHGRSFGGALALMAQAVSQRAAFVVAAVPTLGWTEGRLRLARAGSTREIGDHLALHPADRAPFLRSLAFFDTMHFADRVGCHALVGVGAFDEVVPPATVYAITNRMAPAPEIMELPVSHTDRTDERRWVEFDRRWTAQVARMAGAAARG
ncbi:MAG: acetylxylan esterase [Acidobacteria bacterium]|nr:acetylxylan esterase [Acidobacteriota bacterium]